MSVSRLFRCHCNPQDGTFQNYLKQANQAQTISPKHNINLHAQIMSGFEYRRLLVEGSFWTYAMSSVRVH